MLRCEQTTWAHSSLCRRIRRAGRVAQGTPNLPPALPPLHCQGSSRQCYLLGCQPALLPPSL